MGNGWINERNFMWIATYKSIDDEKILKKYALKATPSIKNTKARY